MGEKHKEEELKPWITVEGVRNIVTIILVAVIVMLILYIERQHTSIDETKQINSELSTYRESAVLSPFDPNIATLEELRRLGLTRIEALSIIRYREFIKPFRIKEELTSCYNISDSLYYALEPYIVIGEEFKHKSPEPSTNWDSLRNTHNTYTGHRVKTPPLAPSKFLVDTVGVNYLRAIGALSLRQAEVFVKWRDLSGIHCEEELRECYVVSDSIATLLMRYAIFSPRVSRWREDPTAPSPKSTTELVDLNRADSATLRSVRGIGEKSVTEIIKYRNLLGGFHSVEQLTEIICITEGNFKQIISQIFADSCDISKIDVNFASAKEMSNHPYLTQRLRKLLKKRQLKGGWSTIEEMIEDKIFTREEAQRVRPYLHFEVQGVL